MTSNQYDNHINIMINSAKKAGAILLQYRKKAQKDGIKINTKKSCDFVSEADLASEKIILEQLNQEYPQYSVVAEESGAVTNDSDFCWFIDPLDGTTNFLHQHLHFSVSIGLQKNGESVAGVVYAPALGELYHAQINAGAYLNEQKITVSPQTELESSLISTGLPFGKVALDNGHKALRQLDKIMGITSGIRRNGSAALDLCWVAAGRFELYWENYINMHDVAAGIIIAKEAGAQISDTNGNHNIGIENGIIAGNKNIYKQMLPLLK